MSLVYLVQAYLLLHLARLMLWVLPFKSCLRLIRVGERHWREPKAGELIDLQRAIRRASRKTLFNSTCLIQAFTARWMLRRRGIRSDVYFGVLPHKGRKLDAHAWVVSHEMEITPKNGDYKVLLQV